MPTLTIEFVGVNAYVPYDDTDPAKRKLVVYLPNATKLGRDSSRRPLPAHRPTVWQFKAGSGSLINPENLRYFPWSVLHLTFTGSPPVASGLDDLDTAGGPPANRLQLASGLAGTAPRTAGMVTLSQGEVSLVNGFPSSCQIVGWCQQPADDKCTDAVATPSPYPNASVATRVYVTVTNVTHVQLSFTSLLGVGAPLPAAVPLIKVADLERLGIGNVCPENLLRWQRNDADNCPDDDFKWIYELVDPAHTPSGDPIPVFKSLGSDIDATETPLRVLGNLDTGGGGGMGCECCGIIATI